MNLNTAYQDIINQYKVIVSTKSLKNQKPSYITPVIEFLAWLEFIGVNEIKTLEKNPQLIVEYIEYIQLRPNLKTGNPLSKSMKTKLMYAVTVFLEELVNLEILKSAYYTKKRVKNEYVGRTPFTSKEIQKLYESCEDELDKMILHLGYSFGMRRSEISRLDSNDINLGKGYLIVKKGKYSKRREIFNPDSILSELKEYMMNQRQSILVDNGKFIEESFLVNTLGNRMTGNYIAKRFKAILKRSGINRDGSLHCLRATVITQLVEAGMPIEKVQEFSGHVCVDTVHVYAMKRKMKDNLKMVA